MSKIVSTRMGHAIRAYRDRKSVSLIDLADTLDEPYANIHRVEKGGGVKSELFVKLVRLLKVNHKDLESFASTEQFVADDPDPQRTTRSTQ